VGKIDKIVSVRMPQSLILELKELSEKNHFLDVSETIRGLLRQEWLEHRSPQKSKLHELKQISKLADKDKVNALRKTLKLLEELNELE